MTTLRRSLTTLMNNKLSCSSSSTIFLSKQGLKQKIRKGLVKKLDILVRQKATLNSSYPPLLYSKKLHTGFISILCEIWSRSSIPLYLRIRERINAAQQTLIKIHTRSDQINWRHTDHVILTLILQLSFPFSIILMDSGKSKNLKYFFRNFFRLHPFGIA